MIKTLKFIGLSCLILLAFACKNNKAVVAEAETPKWSIRMANSIMQSSDSLLYLEKALTPERKFRIRWQYDVAMLGQVIDKLGNIDPKYSAYMEDYINYFIQEDGSIKIYKLEEYNIDRINPAKNLFTLYKRTGEEKYRIAINQFVDQMRTHPKTDQGGYWHKKVYPSQMWLDGIYMGSPFLAQYAREFNAPEWFDVVALQMTLIYEKTLDFNTGLLYHAWDESKAQRWSNPETGQSPHFWSRAIGWYVMAIVDVLDYMPEQHPQREELISILQKTCDALVKVRDPEKKLWYQVLDKGGMEGNYIEGSGSSMFTYAFAKGASKKYLDKKYTDLANESFDAIIKELITEKPDGTIAMKDICGGCGLGGNPYRDGSYEYYITERKVVNDTKGVAPFIMAALELNR